MTLNIKPHKVTIKIKKEKRKTKDNFPKAPFLLMANFVDFELAIKPIWLRQNLTAMKCERLDSFQKQGKYKQTHIHIYTHTHRVNHTH